MRIWSISVNIILFALQKLCAVLWNCFVLFFINSKLELLTLVPASNLENIYI